MALDPALEVVGVVGSEDFASSEVVSKMRHDFLSFSREALSLPCDYIIPQNPSFVKGFWESFLDFFIKFFALFKNVIVGFARR